MNKEYIYYPYCHEVDKETLPPRVQKLLEVRNMSRVIKKMIIMACNDMEDNLGMIKSIDYLMCKHFFPLEANDIYWEMYHDLVKSLLAEEKKLFFKIGILEKDNVSGDIAKGDMPDLNQLFTRMTLYNFYAGWYSKDKELCEKSAVYLAEQCFDDIVYFMELKDSEDPFADKEEYEKKSYLLEISNWLSMESFDGGYGEAAIDFYDELINSLEKYQVSEEKLSLYNSIEADVISDYKDVIDIVLNRYDVKMEELSEQMDIYEANRRTLEGTVNYLFEIEHMINKLND